MESNKLMKIMLVCLLSSFANSMQSQTFTKYWVKFKDKNNSPYSVGVPSAYLSARSIARRTNQNIAIDITDLPVNQTYIDQVNATGAQVFQRSKWMNAAIVIISNPSQLTAINSLTCVLSTAPVARIKTSLPDETTAPVTRSFKQTEATAGYNYGPSLTQVSQIGADCMHGLGYRGQNMVIAVIDAGFDQADINPVFDSLRNEGRILGTRDYVQGNTSVYEDYLHGANCLSLMAGNTPGQLIGTAPKASYWLLRSEDAATEKIIEENNWVVAAEFADSVGADITTTSLGYTTFDISSQNHTYADLNGRTSVASIAATMAARKGIFVLNAAGNEGGGSWNYIGVPADADSICTVGSVNGAGVHSGFSSVGPTADGRIKPDLSSMGEGSYVCAPGYSFQSGNGTSYATPILAGAVACLWQAHPNRTNMAILAALKATASKSSNPNNSYGWGIPDMCAAHNYLNTNTLVQEHIAAISFKVFPNPVKQQLNFTVNQKPESVTLTDVLGKTINVSFTEVQSNQYQIQLDHTISNGMYFISIKTTEGLMKSKFVKE
ncbi:MAG: S8 family serine peptidase [Bacteroidetes bacterium]|nr:S8 family serine peptidase [Bacteroidota bacterium]